MRHRTLERVLLAANVVAIGVGLAVALSAAPSANPRPPLEIWGLVAGDEVDIDGTSVPIKTGGVARSFAGDPAAVNAPLLRELSAGHHEVVVRRVGCAPRTFAVEMQGAHKHTIVFAPAIAAHCALAAPPARAP